MRLWLGLHCLLAVVVTLISSTTRAFAPRASSPPTRFISTTRHPMFNNKKQKQQQQPPKATMARTKTIRKPVALDMEEPVTPSWQTMFTIPTPAKSKPTAATSVTNRRTDTASPTNSNNATEKPPLSNLLLPIGALVAAVLVFVGTSVAMNAGMSPSDVAAALQDGIADPQAVLQGIVNGVQAMGPVGAFYFGLFYCIAELLAVPATPLTLSAGTLFGLGPGVGIVLTAGTVAACVGFGIGKTLLRSYVEGVVADNPKFAKLDTAIGKDGFKLLVLVRLSPIFPFSLTNYIYGSSSIDFVPFFWGTLLGFTPSTIAYVYTGMVGQELLMGDATQPWYVYAGGLGALLTLLKLVTDVASGLVEAIEEGDETR